MIVSGEVGAIIPSIGECTLVRSKFQMGHFVAKKLENNSTQVLNGSDDKCGNYSGWRQLTVTRAITAIHCQRVLVEQTNSLKIGVSSLN